jgi:murein L,D-transpeptidase YcbB/YkuD
MLYIENKDQIENKNVSISRPISTFLRLQKQRVCLLLSRLQKQRVYISTILLQKQRILYTGNKDQFEHKNRVKITFNFNFLATAKITSLHSNFQPTKIMSLNLNFSAAKTTTFHCL